MTVEQAWLCYPAPRPRAVVRLLCFPYAGAPADVFSALAYRLPGHIEVAAVCPPGRAGRPGEPAPRSVPELVAGLVPSLPAHMHGPYRRAAFYGQGLGAQVAFETARELRRRALPGPSRLLVAGCRAPSWPPVEHAVPDHLFAASILALTRRGSVRTDDRGLLADLTAQSTYRYRPGRRLSVPVHAFHANHDLSTDFDQLSAWAEHTERAFSLTRIDADHSFLRTHLPFLTQAMAATLT
ncbi:MAG TPA: thioesterase domain-containing protein [Pseudonocardiaceae bacterium]